jgi:hypothetical protein
MSKQKITTCLVYSKETPLKFTGGLLGAIDLHNLSFLVDSKGNLFKEPSDKAETNVKNICESQEYPIVSMNLYKSLLVVEVDLTNNSIHEQMSWRDIKSDNKETLGWRTVKYPTMAGTLDECLGFSAAAKTDSLGGLYNVATIIPFILN